MRGEWRRAGLGRFEDSSPVAQNGSDPFIWLGTILLEEEQPSPLGTTLLSGNRPRVKGP